MRIILLCLSIIFCCSSILGVNLSTYNDETVEISNSLTGNSIAQKKRFIYADVIAERLKEQKWNNEETSCKNTLMKALENSRNFTLWAIWMLDAMQLPVGQLYGSNYHFGNYDECLKTPWANTHPEYNTKYCLAQLQLTKSSMRKNGNDIDPDSSAEAYIKTRSKYGRDFARVTWGICVPEVCTSTAVIKTFRTLLDISTLHAFSQEANITLEYCEVAGKPYAYPSEFYLFLLAVPLLFVIACCCSYYTKHYYDSDKNSYVQEVIRSFCFRRNIDSLTKARDDEICVLNVLRVISSILLVFGHIVFCRLGRMVINGMDFERDFDVFGRYIAHGTTIVDTFMVMSGLLLTRGFLNGDWTNPFKFLIKRYVRLFGCLFFMVNYVRYVAYHTADGPVWHKFYGVEKETCEKKAWMVFAMISNYFFSTGDTCYPITWSIPVDFQQGIIAVIICCIYRNNKRIGGFVLLIIYCISVVMGGVSSYVKDLPAVYFMGIESVAITRNNRVLRQDYNYTHIRIGPFLIGIVLAYIIHVYNPANYKKVISRKWSIALTAMAWMVMDCIQRIGYYLYMNPDRLLMSIFSAINRNLWAGMIVIIICVCVYGDIGGLRELLNWPPLKPLSRLTYGVYLIHFAIVERNVFSSRAPFSWNLTMIFLETAALTVFSFAGAFFIWLLIEAPLINMTNLCLDGIKTTKAKTAPTTTLQNDNVKKEKSN